MATAKKASKKISSKKTAAKKKSVRKKSSKVKTSPSKKAKGSTKNKAIKAKRPAKKSAGKAHAKPSGGAGSSARSAAVKADELPKVYSKLRAMIHRHRKKLHVYQDDEKGYGANAPTLAPNSKPYFFAGATLRKGYVSYYLFPVYCKPSLLEGMSPELKKRMQGKSCFNFKRVDDELFAELDALTRAGYADFVASGIIK